MPVTIRKHRKLCGEGGGGSHWGEKASLRRERGQGCSRAGDPSEGIWGGPVGQGITPEEGKVKVARRIAVRGGALSVHH